MKKARKYSVLIRYYQYVTKKHNAAKRGLNESEVIKWRNEKYKFSFVDSCIAKDYAKHGFTHTI